MGSDTTEMGAKASHESLSKEDLDFLVSNTHYTEDTICDWYRGFRQDCPGGKLSKEVFLKIYTKCFPTGHTAQFCDHVFRSFDTDSNGVIDFKEFLIAMDVTSSGTPEEKLSWAFRMYDVDGNGWIDLVEMTKLVKSIYAMIGPTTAQHDSPEARAKEIFQRMDINCDGRITKDEFIQTCLVDQNLIQLLTP